MCHLLNAKQHTVFGLANICCFPHTFPAAVDDEESGWKYVHGDVFRFPPQKNLFCAFVGTGSQVRLLQLGPPSTTAEVPTLIRVMLHTTRWRKHSPGTDYGTHIVTRLRTKP